MEPVDALTEASFYSAAPDLITDDTKAALFSMVESLTVTSSTTPTPEVLQQGT